MSDTTNGPVGATPGEHLKQAREQAGLSLEKVAKDLFLDVHKIKSIESNRFNDLGAPVYAKGYLKKYARLVGLAEDDVLRRYEALSDAPAVADPIPVTMGLMPEPRRPLPRWILWVVVAVIVMAGLATLTSLRKPSTESVTQSNLVSRPLSPPTRVQTNAVPLDSETGAASESAQAGMAVSSTSAANLTVRLQFTGNSWVEIYDARNKVVLYDMGTTNTLRDITGMPPLRVVLGAADAVKLQVNSQAISIPASHVEAGVAHFVLNASGELQ
jgi:cytoskeleton protein RodZ